MIIRAHAKNDQKNDLGSRVEFALPDADHRQQCCTLADTLYFERSRFSSERHSREELFCDLMFAKLVQATWGEDTGEADNGEADAQVRRVLFHTHLHKPLTHSARLAG